MTHSKSVQTINVNLKDPHKIWHTQRYMIDVVWPKQCVLLLQDRNNKFSKVINLAPKGWTGTCACVSLILTYDVRNTRRSRRKGRNNKHPSTSWNVRCWIWSCVFLQEGVSVQVVRQLGKSSHRLSFCGFHLLNVIPLANMNGPPWLNANQLTGFLFSSLVLLDSICLIIRVRVLRHWATFSISHKHPTHTA